MNSTQGAARGQKGTSAVPYWLVDSNLQPSDNRADTGQQELSNKGVGLANSEQNHRVISAKHIKNGQVSTFFGRILPSKSQK